MSAGSTRERIIEVADELFYQRGYEHTSLSDIADAVGLSRGNFYHHFKTKDGILDAVIDLRVARTRGMLEQWELADAEPAARIRCFIDMLVTNRGKIMHFGCPVGTLCNELAKLEHDAKGRAAEIFKLLQRWLSRQFALLDRKADADALAMHLLARSQGIATMATAFRDEKFVRREVQLMLDWLDTLCAAKRSKH